MTNKQAHKYYVDYLLKHSTKKYKIIRVDSDLDRTVRKDIDYTDLLNWLINRLSLKKFVLFMKVLIDDNRACFKYNDKEYIIFVYEK